MAKRFWIREMLQSRAAGKITALALTPLAGAAWLFGLIQSLRRWLYRRGFLASHHPGVPTLCVGNITVGGTGKTPCVEAVCRALRIRGVKPVIISRGYGGSMEGRVVTVSDGEEVFFGPEEVGDEPVMLARKLKGVPVVIGAKRREAAALAIKEHDAQALVLDDGFQHLPLARDANIIVVDATRPLGNGHCLPRGTLREPPTALVDARLILLNKTAGLDEQRIGQVKAELARYNPDAPVLVGSYRAETLRTLGGPSDATEEEVQGAGWLTGRKILAFAGIGNPEVFFSDLQRLGAMVMESVPYPDHHVYTADQVEQLCNWARLTNAEALVTTEKDAVRLEPFYPMGHCTYALGVQMEFTQGREVFDRLMDEIAAKAGVQNDTSQGDRS